MMSRFPVPGETKTRLIPGIGAKRAAELHQQLIQWTWNQVRQFQEASDCEIEICYSGGTPTEWQTLLGNSAGCVSQQGHGLGERLTHAVQRAFESGVKNVLVIGTDCYQLTPKHLSDAQAALASSDVVIGPAEDGGYYLIGMKTPASALFDDIAWGTSEVFDQTKQRCRELSYRMQTLATLSDVDTPVDLLGVREEEATRSFLPAPNAGKLSVIIPTFQEERVLGQTLQQFAGEVDVEVIVVDGGSTDRTADIARQYGVKFFQQNGGRGQQLNAGAAVSESEYLLFLHADTRLPENYFDTIVKTLDNGALAGAFRLSIAEANRSLRFVAWAANVRSQLLKMPYGDQGLFIRAPDFVRLRGYPNQPIMDDYEFVRRLNRQGKVRTVNEHVTTSARRWQRVGVWRNTLLNQVCVAAYHLGVPSARIAEFYRNRKGRGSRGAEEQGG